MSDAAIGFLILGLAILVVLGTVFAVTLRLGPSPKRPSPPRGVHLPAPSWLPVVFAVGASLIGAGLAFRPDDLIVQPVLAGLGLLTFVAGIVGWVRAANREWKDVEHGADHSSGGH